MGVPSWLATDPVEAKVPPRARPGWAPRPNNKVKLVQGWQVPERGAGQDDTVPTRDDWYNDPDINPQSTATPATPENLTSPVPPDTVSPESNASTLAPPTPAPARSVLQSRPAQASRSQPQVSSGASAPPPQGPRAATPGSSQDRFLKQLTPSALKVSQDTGIPYQLLLAIPANETGWGSAVAGNNYYGIKGSNPKTGANTGQVGTWEVVNGQRVNINDTFRAYDNPEESMRDFAALITSTPRYANVMSYLAQHPNDWRGAVRIMLDDGYATDPAWADKIISLGSQIDQPDATSPMNAGPGFSVQTGIQSVVSVGSQAIGQKYQFGGAGGRGQSAIDTPTDCSGFVSWAYESATGVRLPAQTSAMYPATLGISPKEAMPGDLVFFNMGQGDQLEHVGIYVGNGMMMHDSSLNPDGGVDVTPIWSGAEFRRVPNVDQSLVTQPDSATSPRPNDTPSQWVIVAQHGQQVWIGATPDGRTTSQTLGPLPQGSAIPEGRVLDSYWAHQKQQSDAPSAVAATLTPATLTPATLTPGPALPGGGNEMGAGAEDKQPTMAKKEAAYTKRATEDHCQDCSMFRSNACTLVKGYIHNLGSCDYFEPKKSKMGAGQDEGDSTDQPPYYSGYVDAQGNTVDLPPPSDQTVSRAADLGWLGDQYGPQGQAARSEQIVNRAALEDQRLGEQTQGEVSQAQDQAQNTADQANIQNETEFLKRNQAAPATANPPPAPISSEQANTDIGRFDLGQQPDTARRSITDQPPLASQTGQGTVRHALPPVPLGPAPVQQPTPPAPEEQPFPTPTVPQSGPGTTLSPLGQRTNMPQLGAAAERQAAEEPATQEKPITLSMPALLNISPENQQRLATAYEIAQDITDPAGHIGPGVAQIVDNVRTNGYDPQAALDRLLLPSDKGSMSYKVAHGGVLNPMEAVQLGAEWQDKMNTFRADLVRAAQPASMQGTPEGEAAAEGIALVTDPLNYIGWGKVGAGRKLLEDTGSTVAPKLEQTVERLAGRDYVGQAARTLARPYDAAPARSILQQASLDIGGEEGTRLLNNGRALGAGQRYEPLSGEQIRRTVLNSVARANPTASASQILALTDETLLRSAPELTTDALAAQQHLLPHIPGLEAARTRWYDSPPALQAHLEELGRAVKWSRSPGAAQTMLAVRAGGAGLAALGMDQAVDQNDPYRNYKIAGAGLFGALAPAGLGWAAGHISGAFDRYVLDSMKKIFAPIERLSTPVRDALRDWAGLYTVGSTGASRLSDQMIGAFGRGANLDLVKTLEETGKLPGAYRNNPAAVEFLRRWNNVTSWAVKYDVVPNEINFVKPGSKAKMYVPHAVDSEMSRALEIGQRMAEPRRGRLAVNPFDYYNQERIHETISAGEKAGVKYAEDVPRTFGNYYSTAVKRLANDQLVNKLITIADKNNPNRFGPNMQQVMLLGEDVVRLPPGWTGARLTNAVNIDNYMPQFRNQNVFISSDLAKTFDNLFKDPSWFDNFAGVGKVVGMGDMLKHNVLGGSAFHLINETRQLFATQGWSAPGNLVHMVKDMTTPGGARNFYTREAAGINQAIRDGLNMNLAADRPVMEAKERFATMLMNAVLGGAAGYQVGDSEEERQANMLKMAGVGMAAGMPLLKGKSFVEQFSTAMWNRYIPFMKYTTYSMYAPQFGGRAAAEFANEVFGGQNLLAIGRSRTTQDVLKLVMLAPDWQEGWARQIGNAAFNWGGNAPLGKMNRHYWSTAAMQSVALLEGMNMAFGGHPSWQNDPDAALMVDATKFYDLVGWPHHDPGTGNPHKVYWDVLGPYRSMLQPLIETARAATAATANALGIPPGQLPFDKEIRGKFGEVPESDPGQAWRNFLGSRVGILPVTAQELITNRDFAGRPTNQPDDGFGQQVVNRIAQASQHFLPTGEQQLVASGQRGDPFPVALFSAFTGARTKHESQTNRYFTYQDQYVKDLGLSLDQWNDRQTQRNDHNKQVDTDIELIQSGLRNKDGSDAAPGKSDMTGRERDQAISDKWKERQSQRDSLAELITQGMSPEDQAKYKLQLKWLNDQTVIGGSDSAPSDLNNRPDLDIPEIVRQAYNRDPDEIARITHSQPPAQNTMDSVGRALQKFAQHTPPGSDPTRQLAQLRGRWTTETAYLWNIDPAVLDDVVKAQIYKLPNGLPTLPNVSSKQLDDITTGYSDAGKDSVTGAERALSKQDYLFETASQLGVDPQDLLTRIRLRTLPMADQTPSALERSNALDLFSNGKMVPYQNTDGTSYGDPAKWKEWDTKLVQYKDKTHYSTRDKLYYQNGKPWDELNAANAAKQQATADRYKVVLRAGPEKANAYYRSFGDGADMTDAQWRAYNDGTLTGFWTDNPDPEEFKRRVTAMRTGQALTKTELDKHQEKWTWVGPDLRTGKPTQLNTTLGAYLAYIAAHKSPGWKGVGVGPMDDSG